MAELPVNAQKFIGNRPDLPGPPNDPATFDVPPRPAVIPGDPDNTQTIVVQTPDGPEKRTVVPGWDNPVNFTSN